MLRPRLWLVLLGWALTATVSQADHPAPIAIPESVAKTEAEMKPYAEVIEDLLLSVPDLSLSVPDYAVAGDLTFVRWVATGTAPDGAFEALGCDRVRVRKDGLVVENYIFCDHPFFSVVAERNRQRR